MPIEPTQIITLKTKKTNPITLISKKEKQSLFDIVKLKQRTETSRKIKFKKNQEYIESGITTFHHNLDITIRLDRMIKYLLAESSKNKKGVEQDNKFDNDLKTPFADLWSEGFVHIERSDGTSEILIKEIEFIPDSGSHEDMIRFSRFFNINQIITEDNLKLTNDSNILGSIKGDTDVFKSPFVLLLSSYDNKLNKHSNDFSNELLSGAGRGGILIQPESYGYYSNIHKNSSSNENINSKTYFRIGDIEKEFEFQQSDVKDNRNNIYIVPAALIGQQFNLNSQYKPELFNINENVLLGYVKGTELTTNKEINNIMLESLKNKDKAFNNQYLKLWERGLIRSRVEYIQKFVEYYTTNSDSKLNLFTEVKTNLFISKPIVLRPRTDDTFDIGGRVTIVFELDIRNAVSNSYVGGISSYGTTSLSNWKLDPGDSGDTYIKEPFIIYN